MLAIVGYAILWMCQVACCSAVIARTFEFVSIFVVSMKIFEIFPGLLVRSDAGRDIRPAVVRHDPC